MEPGLFRGIVPFVAVAEERSFRRAAARLGLTKAAVSKAVRALERELGTVLLQRSPRAVSLTADGARFWERCRDAVHAASVAREEARRAREAPGGTVRLSVSFIVEPLVIDALALLRVRHPRLVVDLRASDRMARFADEAVDVAVRVGVKREASLSAKLLRRTRWVTVASPAYLASAPRLERAADLAAHPRLAFVDPEGRPREWTLRGERAPATDVALLVDFGPSLVRGATAGLGVAQVLDFMVTRALDEGALVEVLPELSAEGPSITAVHTLGRRVAPNVRAVVDALTEAFA